MERPEACDHRPEERAGHPRGCAASPRPRTLVTRQRHLKHASAPDSILHRTWRLVQEGVRKRKNFFQKKKLVLPPSPPAQASH